MHCAVIFDTSKDRGACPPLSSLSGLPFTQVEVFIVHNPSNNRSSQNPCHYRQGTFQTESYFSHTIQILTNMIKIWLSKWKPRDGNKKKSKGIILNLYALISKFSWGAGKHLQKI